jgi:hypothetical protein
VFVAVLIDVTPDGASEATNSVYPPGVIVIPSGWPLTIIGVPALPVAVSMGVT